VLFPGFGRWAARGAVRLGAVAWEVAIQRGERPWAGDAQRREGGGEGGGGGTG